MNHSVNFSGDWKEPGYFYYELADVLFCFFVPAVDK